MKHLVQISLRNFADLLKSKRQDDIRINTLEEDNTNASDNYGKDNVLNDYFHSILTNEKLNSLLSLDPSLSHPSLNQIIVTSLVSRNFLNLLI